VKSAGRALTASGRGYSVGRDSLIEEVHMKRYVAIVSVAVVALAVTAGLAASAEKAVVTSASELKWVDNPAVKGAKQAVLWGDPAKGAYGTLKSIPGGTVLGLHTHTNAQRVVVVSGTIEFNMEGEAKKDLGAGSFVSIPAAAPHDATCKAGADCVYFEEGMGAADFKPVATKK
jgi:quercetin dioxygenase-like cupin family protein